MSEPAPIAQEEPKNAAASPSDSSDAAGAASPDDGKAPPSGQPMRAAMGGAVGRGMVWMMLNTAIGRVATALAQVALGFLLVPDEFGVAAIAIAVSAFVQVFRDGGCRQLLVQKGPEAYNALVGPVFWMALAFNTGSFLLLCAVAPLVAWVYNDPRFVTMLPIIGAYLPLGTVGAVLQARLSIDMRFRAVAQISGAAAVLRQILIVAFALSGMGPLSFVLPMPIVGIFESVATYLVARGKPWRRVPEPGKWRGILRQTIWIVLGTFATAAYNQGEYVALGLLVSKFVVGVYFFSFQIAKQIIVLLMANVHAVLLPALSQLNEEPDRQRAAILRSVRIMMIVAAPTSLIVVVIIEPLVRLLWGGQRWMEAVVPIQILSAVLPLNILSGIPRTVLMSRGRFRLWSVILLLDACGVILSGVAGAVLSMDRFGIAFFQGESNDAIAIAACTGLYTAVSTLLYARPALHTVHVALRTLVRNFLPALALTAAIAASVLLFDRLALAHRPPLLRIIVLSAAFSGLFAVLARLFLERDITQLVMIAPARLRAPLAALWRVRLPDRSAAAAARASG